MDYNVIGVHEWFLFQGLVWEIKVTNDLDELILNKEDVGEVGYWMSIGQ